MIKIIMFALGLLFSVQMSAYAVNPDEVLKNPVLENRARDISKNLRCLVCQNQSIDESNADLAKDLRVLVRERLAAGDSDQEVIDFVVDRYGDYVLLKPPLKPVTYVLWSGPALFFLLILWIGFRLFRRQAQISQPKEGTVQ